MRRRSMLLVGAISIAFIVGSLAQGPAAGGASSARHEAPRETPELMSDLDDTFSYDFAARYNDGIVSNIDAIDTALATILAGNVAVLVLAIDKIKELAPIEAACAIALICISTMACLAAYVIGFPMGSSKRDGLRPRIVIPDLVERPKEALIAAVIGLVTAGERNLTMRFVKKALAVLAILFLLAGAVVVALARANGDMVY